MKKKVLLILTVIISMVLCIDRVNAATELTCVYKKGITQKAAKIVQYKDGTKKQFEYRDGTKKPSASSDNWAMVVHTIFNEDVELTKCPEYIDTDGKIKFSDTSKVGYTKRIEEIQGVVDKSNDKYNKTIYVRCDYEDELTLYYVKDNNNKYIAELYDGTNFIFNAQKQYTFIDGSLMESYYNSKVYCPEIIYYKKNDTHIYSTKKSSGCSGIIGKCNEAKLVKTNIFIENNKENVENPTPTINTCADLIGPNMRIFIDSIMKWIRILVPLLLIGLGIMDFSKAVFSSKEDDMKKSRERFIKRIIAAILVFLVPIFVNLILDLGNKAWSNINKETCLNK